MNRLDELTLSLVTSYHIIIDMSPHLRCAATSRHSHVTY